MNYTENNVVTTNTSLSTIDSEPLYNCQGFSGSGVFCDANGRLFLLGLVYELEEPFQRFKVCDLSFLNDLLAAHNLPTLQFEILPVNESIAKDIQKLVSKSNLVLDGIINSFGNDLVLERGTVDNELDRKFSGNRLLIFKGEAGAGKSACAKSTIVRLREANYAILAFKADAFARGSIEEALPYLDNGLGQVLLQLGQQQQVVILIDSLEKLLEVETYEALKEFLRICKQFTNIRIVVTCRSFAYQQMIFELHYDFPKYDFIDVPLLDDAELAKIETHFPFLQSLLEQGSFRKILRRPFYLNLVILHYSLFKDGGVITEREFRRLVWDEVISKDNLARGGTFEKIALQRAISMNLYARIEGADPLVVEQLRRDGIIFVEESLGDAYSPAHDIYEDIALIRFIERIFQEKRNAVDFFNRLGGKEPAKRRAFRLWLNDRLIDATADLTLFISTVLEETEVEQYWKDEAIIALLKSENCQNFVGSNQDLLEDNHHALLLRFIHLLRTTCQEPDEQLAQALKDERQGNIYQLKYLRPVGPGWQVLLNYVSEHLHDLRDHWRLVLKLVTQDWSKKLDTNAGLPLEAQAAGRILLEILNDAKNNYSSRRETAYSKEDVDEAIKVLFNLCSIFRDEVWTLIETANAFGKHSSENYNLRDFYASVIEFSLSGLWSREICREFPDLVCKLALDHWLQHGPSKDRYSFSLNFESDFGLADRSSLDYFPAGIYKTPVRFLLYFHPVEALRLIVVVLNHATSAYATSERGKSRGIVEVKIFHQDGSFTTQNGNAVLWAMYRGTVEATSYLLESILMSLENWLLELCQIKDEWASRWIELAYSYLLKTSTTVATTAVLASVALAYPRRVNRLCLPILKVKEFYGWDIARLVGDQHALAPLDRDIAFAQAERHSSNQLPHRKYTLETLVTKLQVEGYWDEINEIIDGFQRTAEQEDTHWKLALNRMDIRKYEVDESIEPPEKNQIILKPKIDEDLVGMVEESQQDLALTNKAMNVANWARYVYEGKEGVDKSPEGWRREYQSYCEIRKIDNESVRLFGDPTYLAAVGIKFFHTQLSVEELHWCVDIILDVLEDRIVKNISHDPFYKTIFFEPAIQTVPLILSLELDDEKRRQTKEIIFCSLLHLVSHEMEYPFESIRSNLWKIDEAFAHSCLAGLTEYAVLHRHRKYYYSQSEEADRYQREFFEQEEQLVSRVCDNEIELGVEKLSFDTHSHWYLGFAAQIIPLDTCNELYRSFVKQLFQLLFRELAEKERDRYHDRTEYIETEQSFKHYLARFLLSQSSEYSRELFSDVLDSIFTVERKDIDYTAYEFVEGIIEAIILEEDNLQAASFWNLWEVLYSKIKASQKPHFISYLFLSMRWWNSDAEDWAPLENKRLYIRKLIMELGHSDIGSVVKLLAGIGTKQLLPDGLIWLGSALLKTSPLQALNNSNTFWYCEKLIRRVYYKYLKLTITLSSPLLMGDQ